MVVALDYLVASPPPCCFVMLASALSSVEFSLLSLACSSPMALVSRISCWIWVSRRPIFRSFSSTSECSRRFSSSARSTCADSSAGSLEPEMSKGKYVLSY